jgi:hypothetical protein
MKDNNMNDTFKWPLIIGATIVVGFLAYTLLTMSDQRSPAEKVGDAIHDLPKGVDKAGRQLEDRTPGQKLGDAVKDTGDKIKDNTNP